MESRTYTLATTAAYMSTKSTTTLIAEYDARMASRWTNCQPGSTRAASRQRKINALVDELTARASAGDAEAEAWLSD